MSVAVLGAFSHGSGAVPSPSPRWRKICPLTPRSWPSRSAEPVVAAIFPEPPGHAVGDIHGRDPFRVLEAELGRYSYFEWKAIFGGNDLVGKLEGHDGLRMKCRRHVDAAVISIGAFESDVFSGEVGADPLQKHAEWRATPFPDHAPTLDADMTRNLTFLR